MCSIKGSSISGAEPANCVAAGIRSMPVFPVSEQVQQRTS